MLKEILIVNYECNLSRDKKYLEKQSSKFGSYVATYFYYDVIDCAN